MKYLFVSLLFTINFFLFSCGDENEKENNTITDYDGNVYHVVTIGTQVWMVENLKTTHYRDGTDIPNVTDNSIWSNLTTGAYCNYNNNSSNAKTYGRLYNWYAVNDSRNIAPTGWHVPTGNDWATLTDYLGGQSVAGGKLKETGTAHWINPNTGATNDSGFTALPGGNRNNSSFVNMGFCAFWWSSTESSTTNAWYRCVFNSSADLYPYDSSKKSGFSIRCVRDN